MNYKYLSIFLAVLLACSVIGSVYAYETSEITIAVPYIECPNCHARGDSLDPVGMEIEPCGYASKSSGWSDYYCRNCGMQFAVYSKIIDVDH